MFTGIIESLGTVKKIEQEGSNVHFSISSPIAPELKIDQSVAHNGVCLTVVAVEGDTYVVTAVQETMQRTNLGNLQMGDLVNLERAMLANARLDGHIVQGHVDGTGTCIGVEEVDGSWYYRFEFDPQNQHLLVDKGSVCINGVSLTVINPDQHSFSVAIIPYTYQHTNFHRLAAGSPVNFEFDIIGKYVARMAEAYKVRS